MSFGIGWVIRDKLVGIETVDYDSGGYYWGGWTGVVADFLTGGGTAVLKSLGKGVAKSTGKKFVKEAVEEGAEFIGREVLEQTARRADDLVRAADDLIKGTDEVIQTAKEATKAADEAIRQADELLKVVDSGGDSTKLLDDLLAPVDATKLSPTLLQQKELAQLVNKWGAVVDRWLSSSSNRWAKLYRDSIQSNPNFANGIRGRILDIRTRSKFRDMFGDTVPGVRIDQTIPGSGNSLRPDLFFPNLGGRRVIFDVGSPSKIGGIQKYQGMADDLIPLVPVQWIK
jgi:hypothetical protein